MLKLLDYMHIMYYIEKEGGTLTAFCPSTAHKIPSDAFARHARIMYVGSIYFTSE